MESSILNIINKDAVHKELIRMRELADGKYVMTDYEFKSNNYGPSYIIICEDENKNTYRCWTNLYMYRY